MRFIKRYKTFELKDETYLSTADRLEKNHPKRARALRKHVDDRQSVDIDYIDPRPLNGMGGNRYYITDVEVVPNETYVGRITKGNGNDIIVTLESVNDIFNLYIYNFYTDSASGMTHHINTYHTPWGPPGYSSKTKEMIMNFPSTFYFVDRKSARIFMEVVEKEAGEKLLFSINDAYIS